MSRGVVLDANLIVLLVIGTIGVQHIARHKRLGAYRPGDYDLLIRHLQRFDAIILTPNTLTEASNLLCYAAEPLRTEAGRALAVFVRQHPEVYAPSADVVEQPAYIRLGLADSVLLGLAADGNELLTADLELYLAALRAGRAATNFAHLQAAEL